MDEYARYGDDVAALMDWGERAQPTFGRVRAEFERSVPPTDRLGRIRNLYVDSMLLFERSAEMWAAVEIDAAVSSGNVAVDRWDDAVSAVEKLRS